MNRLSRAATRLPPAALALAGYAVASLVLFGRGVVASPASTVVGDAGADKTIYMWSFRWWPHALAHGHDPFRANVVWMPHGIDLAWATTVPLLSVVLTPLTAAAGSIVSYNVAALAAPTLSAWTGFFLCRALTSAFVPSLIGGWIFGFSAYELGQLTGHLNLAFVPMIPLIALLALEHLRGSIASRRFVVLMTLALVGQFLISTEIFLDAILVAAAFALAIALLVPELRASLRATTAHAAVALGVCLLVVSPYLWHAFVVAGTKSAPARAPFTESADLLNYIVPTHRIWLQLPHSRAIASRFTATGAERGAYIGLPLAAIVIAYLWRRRSSHVARAVGLALAAVVIASLGARVRVAGHVTVPAPWRVFATLPVTRTVLPVRLTVFAALVAAAIAAAWLAAPDGRRAVRYAAAIVAIAFLFPQPSTRLWAAAAPNPAFFRTRAYRDAIPHGATVLVFPFGAAGWSLLWQAEDRFGYRLVGGHFGRRVTVAEEGWKRTYQTFADGRVRDRGARLRSFLRAHDVTAIVVAPGTRPAVRRLAERLGGPGRAIADAVVYRVGP